MRSRDCSLMASYQPKNIDFLAKPRQARSHNFGNANSVILIDSSEESDTQEPDAVATQERPRVPKSSYLSTQEEG